MSRTEKLFSRLAELEQEFAALIKTELEAVSAGNSSMFLSSRILNATGRKRADEAAHYLADVETEIRALRDKLGTGSGDDDILGMFDAFIESAQGSPHRSNGDQTALSRRYLAQVERYLSGEDEEEEEQVQIYGVVPRYRKPPHPSKREPKLRS